MFLPVTGAARGPWGPKGAWGGRFWGDRRKKPHQQYGGRFPGASGQTSVVERSWDRVTPSIADTIERRQDGRPLRNVVDLTLG
jgi:hypothetical protein